jgi:hypothetical protein
MLAKSCTKLEKISTLFVVFFARAHLLLICRILLTNTSRTPLVTYEKQGFSDACILCLPVRRWENSAQAGKRSKKPGKIQHAGNAYICRVIAL